MIHKFAVPVGNVPSSVFNNILQTFQSDVQSRHSPIAIHGYESNDIGLARKMAQEAINVSGAEVVVYVRTDNADWDRVWDEDPDPTYWNPINLKAYFKPEPLQSELKSWGIDTPNRTEVTFSHYEIYGIMGERMLRPGDVIQLPYNSMVHSPQYYRILNVTPAGNFRFIWLYLNCSVETLTADKTVRVVDDMGKLDDETPDVYRETVN